MPKKILSVLAHTEYGNLEDSDIGLFASAFAAVAGNPLTVLLREDAVNYAVRGQNGSGITIAGGTVQPGFMIESDLAAVSQAKTPVYAVHEDVAERGITAEELISGVTLLRREEVGRFVDRFDTVWNW